MCVNYFSNGSRSYGVFFHAHFASSISREIAKAGVNISPYGDYLKKYCMRNTDFYVFGHDIVRHRAP